MLIPRQSGFTLIELLVGVSLMGVLLALGAPTMATYLQNSKVGTAATNIYTAIQSARTEAIRRNVTTEFMLTNTVIAAGVETAAVPNLSGQNWVVRAASGATFVFVDAKTGAEGSGQTAASVRVAASGPGLFDGTIGFNGFGGTVAGVDFSVDIDNPSAGTCAAVGGAIRCRRVIVKSGGQITVCDPALPALAKDSRVCP
jgi:type IV fimbrial biogenesis protein FimT